MSKRTTLPEAGRSQQDILAQMREMKGGDVEVYPLAYLIDVLSKIVDGHANRDIDQLLPWAYRQSPVKA